MKYQYTAPVLAALLLSACAPSTDTRQTDVIETSIQIGDFCSGTIVKAEGAEIGAMIRYTVLTARHCVLKDMADLKSFQIGDAFDINKYDYVDNEKVLAKKAYEGHLNKVGTDTDLALITFYTEDVLFVAPVATPEIIQSLKFAEPIYNASFPYSIDMLFSQGFLGHIIEGTEPDQTMFDMKELQMTNMTFAPGSSGSAVFVQRDNRYYVISAVTGIVAVTDGDSNYIGFLTTSKKMLEFLD